MIITSMESFGKARDAGKQMQRLYEDGDWCERNFDRIRVDELERIIKDGKVRTKPKVVYYRAWEFGGELYLDKRNVPYERVFDYEKEAEDD